MLHAFWTDFRYAARLFLRSRGFVVVGLRDPVTLFAVGTLLLAIAAAASWIPARRAAHVEPSVALRD